MKILVYILCALMCLCILPPEHLHAQNDEIRNLLEKVEKSRGKERIRLMKSLKTGYSLPATASQSTSFQKSAM